MVDIKPYELMLFADFLTDLQVSTEGEKKDHRFYLRWQQLIDQITEISKRLDTYLATKDSERAKGVENDKRRGSYQENEFTLFKRHVAYYCAGMKTYKRESEFMLTRGGLLEKPIQEMNGFEFKTLLLLAMSEHADRQKQ